MSVILGLTGSIGMGKSTTAAFFRDAGIPVWDADAAVHNLYAKGGAAVSALAALNPDCLRDDAIDRAVLRDWIARDSKALGKIEAVVHPLVAANRADFLTRQTWAPLVVLDVPLLFESGADRLCDATLVVSAPPEVQRERVLARPGMTDAHLQTILAKQMPDADKRARATYVVETLTLDAARAQVQRIIADLLARPSNA